MRKTVFILGAGFSKPANAPIQSEIIKEILKIEEIGSHPKKAILEEYLKEFKLFLSDGLYIDEKHFANVALEDVFTPIDRCIIDGLSFRSYDTKKLVDLREKIYSLIVHAIKEKLSDSGDKKQYVVDFAKFLIENMKPRIDNIKHDPVSVISTNWDILLDNSIKSEIEKNDNKGVVDYCCYISSLHNDESIKPGLFALGQGKFNVKLLKLHGSMNWLSCPKCQRLFVAFYDKIAEYGIYKDRHCKYCLDNFDANKTVSIALRSNLIMPTFLKDLSNFQIKLIWQNAGIELSESNKIVFIGYSLPQADYELRQLLSRMIPKDAIIEVVMREEINDQTRKSNAETLTRYKTFFGKRKVFSKPVGVEEYVKSLLK